MPNLTSRRALLVVAGVACLVYANALLNGWAGDDPLIIAENVRTHSIRAALDARFQPYWPPPYQDAGAYRPLTILSFALDWTIGGGAPWVFHAGNIVLHALAAGMVVAVALAWLSPLGAFVAGLLFAVHPVHVEAVSNVVGRGELLADVALLAVVLTGRRYRHTAAESAAWGWLALTILLIAIAQLSKEHAVIAVAVLGLDHFLDPVASRRPTASLYVCVAVATLAWLQVWRSIAGFYVAGSATPAFFGMSTAERWTTMWPVQLDVLRLLAWPLDLASDYSPQTIPIRTTWTPIAVTGLVTMTGFLGIGLLAVRRAPAVAFGILLAAGSYFPTSNFLFASGVVVAERTLYLAVLAPALALGWVVNRSRQREHYRILTVAVGLVLAIFVVRTWTRTPFWKTPQTAILDAVGEQLENYRAHSHLGDLFAARRDSAHALAEYAAADAIAERDPFPSLSIVNAAISLKRYDLAVAQARRAAALAPGDFRPMRWLVQSQLAAGRNDSAVETARAAALRHQGSLGHAQTFLRALEEAKAPPGRKLLASANVDWLSGRLIQSAIQIDSLGALVTWNSVTCDDLLISRIVLQALDSAVHEGRFRPKRTVNDCLSGATPGSK